MKSELYSVRDAARCTKLLFWVGAGDCIWMLVLGRFKCTTLLFKAFC